MYIGGPSSLFLFSGETGKFFYLGGNDFTIYTGRRNFILGRNTIYLASFFQQFFFLLLPQGLPISSRGGLENWLVYHLSTTKRNWEVKSQYHLFHSCIQKKGMKTL